MNLVRGLPVAFISSALTWYGSSCWMRSAQASTGSPIETHTSVWMKSTPLTAAFGSSVRVMRAPLSSPYFLQRATRSSSGHRAFGAQIRTSIPSLAPISSKELPMLLRASPR
ncbi:hypothetical protein D9M71_629730 [compost metagenome]